MDDLEKRLRALVSGEFSTITLTFNDHASNYSHDDEFLESYYGDFADFVSEEEKQKAFSNNSVWVLQYYPKTPVGFCTIAASSLSKILETLPAQPEKEGE